MTTHQSGKARSLWIPQQLHPPFHSLHRVLFKFHEDRGPIHLLFGQFCPLKNYQSGNSVGTKVFILSKSLFWKLRDSSQLAGRIWCRVTRIDSFGHLWPIDLAFFTTIWQLSPKQVRYQIESENNVSRSEKSFHIHNRRIRAQWMVNGAVRKNSLSLTYCSMLARHPQPSRHVTEVTTHTKYINHVEFVEYEFWRAGIL